MAKPDDDLKLREDSKLREVKVVLARLQRMSSDPEAYFADLDDEETAGLSGRWGHVAHSRAVWITSALLSLALILGSAVYVLSVTGRPSGNAGSALAVAHSDPQPAAQNPPASAAIAIVPAPALTPAPAPTIAAAPPAVPAPPVVPAPAAATPKTAQPPPAPTADSIRSAAALADAMRLINSGQLQAGRVRLRELADKQLTAEIAWSLARSYDPNFVASITTPDAAAEVSEAERWYRQWHTLALKEGLVSSTSSVDRILQSLR